MFDKLFKIFLLSFLILIIPSPVFSLDNYPKLANYYLAWDISDEQAVQLAKWDLIILSPQAVERNSDLLAIIKKNNPDSKILVYFLTQEINQQSLSMNPQGAWADIYRQVNANNWWLKDLAGQKLTYWPQTYLIDVTNTGWQTWLVDYINLNYLQKNRFWDGVFFDNCWDNVSWLNFSLDLNRDQQSDGQELADRLWSESYKQLLGYAQQKFSADKLVICNGGTQYQELYNGRMFESFPAASEGGWPENLKSYQTTGDYSIINSNTKNNGNYANFQEMRFGLTSSLLANGYFSFDYGDQNHGQLWWYDEYDYYLGSPTKQPVNLLNQQDSDFSPGVWRRDFDRGIVLVNSTAEQRLINLEGDYETIKRSAINQSSQLINQLELLPNDGEMLLKPLSEIIGANFINGSFAKIFKISGEPARNGFFAYQKNFLGGLEIVIDDLDNDGKLEIVAANNQELAIFNNQGKLTNRFLPYGEKFHSGLNFVLADIDNNGQKEILTLPKEKTAAELKIFSSTGQLINPGFLVFPKEFKIGADLTVADLNNDGQVEIIVGAGPGGSAHLRIFNTQGKLLNPGFFAFALSYRGGVNLASGDINGDGQVEILVSKQRGDSEVRIFNSAGKLLNNWLSFKNTAQGVNIGTWDVDGDSVYEIIVLGNDLINVK